MTSLVPDATADAAVLLGRVDPAAATTCQGGVACPGRPTGRLSNQLVIGVLIGWSVEFPLVPGHVRGSEFGLNYGLAATGVTR